MNITRLNIVYEDEYLVVVNKDYNQELSFKELIPLNNLSKEVSGNIVYLKSKNLKYRIKYSYLGIVEGYLDKVELDCKLICRKEKYSIVEFTTLSNDINLREHLMKINHPIIGDYKYKSNFNPIQRICLHLYKIEIDNKTIYSRVPDSFKIFVQ